MIYIFLFINDIPRNLSTSLNDRTYRSDTHPINDCRCRLHPPLMSWVPSSLPYPSCNDQDSLKLSFVLMLFVFYFK